MAHELTGPSLKHDAAIRFGQVLTRTMKRRGVGSRVLADAAGIGRSSVRNWRQGRTLPRIETARRVAAALDSPEMLTLALRLRRKVCDACAAEFTDDSGSDNRRYCSVACRDVAAKGRIGVDKRQRAGLAERKLLDHTRAVAAYCEGCEPQGRCVTAECALRPVSPLPLFERRVDAEMAMARPSNGFRKPGADSDRMRRVWAEYGPQQRAERVANARAERHREGVG